MFDPPPGYDDLAGDCELAPVSSSYHDLSVPRVGVVRARKPMPNAVSALAMAANSRIDLVSRSDYLVLFVRNHLEPGELERVYADMIRNPEVPADAIERIARAVATWGTARPTQPSSRFAC